MFDAIDDVNDLDDRDLNRGQPGQTHQSGRPALQNPLRPHGLVFLIYAGGAAFLGLFGLIHGGNNLFAVAIAVAAGGAAAIRGLMLYLQPFAIPSGAPEGIGGVRKEVGSLLERLAVDDSYLGTYRLPTGLWELIATTLAPQFTNNTPATRSLLHLVGRGLSAAVASIVIGFTLMVNGQILAGFLLAVGALAVAGIRLLVLYKAVPDKLPGRPDVTLLRGDDLRLTEAGNPIALVQNTVRITAPMRNGDESRLSQNGPDRLDRLSYASFQGDVAFESRPVIQPPRPEYLAAAQYLEYASAAICLFGLAIFVLTPPSESAAGIKFVGLAIPGLCIAMMRTAFSLRNTFRFKSDLIAVWFKGNYQYQKGGLNGQRSAEVELVKSDITTVVAGARVLSECTPGFHEYFSPDPERANVQALNFVWSSLKSPRYIVRTVPDPEFRTRMQSLCDSIKQYREVFRDVIGVNLDSHEAQRIVRENVLQDQQNDLFRQQLLMQAQMQNQILAKALEGMAPQQAAQMLAQGGLQAPLPGLIQQAAQPQPIPTLKPITPPVVAAVPEPEAKPKTQSGVITPDVEKKLLQAFRIYYNPKESEDARELAKKLVNDIKKLHGLRSEQITELMKRYQAGLAQRPKPN